MNIEVPNYPAPDFDAPPVLALVIPCYNESESLPVTTPVLLEILDRLTAAGSISSESYMLCVDDGSRDDTWNIIKTLNSSDGRVRGIALARNRGHQNALLAGLMEVIGRCDAAISLDADLQDDPEAIVAMVEEYHKGNDIVYGVRSARTTDTAFKRTSAHAFYSLQKAMGLETVYDHADYRLMSDRALRVLAMYGETNLFLRGIVPQIGFRTAVVHYERNPRVAGVSKYPLSKMLSLSIDGITSFSAKPMRWIFYTGMVTFAVTLLVAVYVLCSYLFGENTMAGWTSIMLSVWCLGSLILMSIGIVGEYIGKIFAEVKHRPRYVVREAVW
ncbi:MAG: glycosyltransferase family 2 protein [Muribaculaceae bacterium]|nr:glycosyltransferase family 2 protein [Muribaculaceae bacterium]